jgi:hypothetical protein
MPYNNNFLLTEPGADQCSSDMRGADFPGGCIGALPKGPIDLLYIFRHIAITAGL